MFFTSGSVDEDEEHFAVASSVDLPARVLPAEVSNVRERCPQCCYAAATSSTGVGCQVKHRHGQHGLHISALLHSFY